MATPITVREDKCTPSESDRVEDMVDYLKRMVGIIETIVNGQVVFDIAGSTIDATIKTNIRRKERIRHK